MFYFEVKCSVKEEVEKLFAVFHQNTYLHDNQIGLSFPYQSNGNIRAIRFFSKSKEYLNKFINCDNFQDLMDTDRYIFKNIALVPEEALPFKIIRHRVDTRYSKDKNKKNYQDYQSNRHVFLKGNLVDLYHIKTKSNNNGNQFSIFYYYAKLDEKDKAITNFKFSSYGFSKDGSYVYSF